MTKKRYDKSSDLSRSKPPPRDIRRPKRRSPPPNTGPAGGYFEALQPDSDDHPVDLLVDRIPHIAKLSRDLAWMADRIKRDVRDRRAFVAYEDLRLHVRTEREVAYYNIGYEQGRLTGRANSLSRDSRARALARDLQIAVMKSALPTRRVAAVLLELGRAHVLELEPAMGSERGDR
jgi:hypothetical protein